MPDMTSVPAPTSREGSVTEAFVELADTLTAGFDPVRYLQMFARRCAELVGVAAAAVTVFDEHGAVQTVAASRREAQLLSLVETQAGEGPGVDCVRTGEAVASPRLSLERRWPAFTAAAAGCGYRAAHSLPVRRGRYSVGVLTLLSTEDEPVGDSGLRMGQGLADMAAVALLQRRTIDHGNLLAGQLQTALSSRVVIEQAKGVLAAHAGLDMGAAFAVLRGYARAHHQRLADLAAAVVSGAADLDVLCGSRPHSSFSVGLA